MHETQPLGAPAYDLRTLAARLSVSPQTIRRFIMTGKIRARKIGTQFRIDAEEAERFIREAEFEPAAETAE